MTQHEPDLRFAHGHCRFCGASVEHTPWVKLNRIAFGTGRCRCASEFHNDDGDYIWEVGDDLDAQEEVVTGPVLCFPDCLQTYLEGRMVEADIRMGHTK